MKKVVLSLALAAATCTAWAQGGVLNLKGNVKGFEDSVVVVMGQKEIPLALKNGTFSTQLQLDKPVNLFIVPKTLRNEENKVIRLLGIPGETAELSGDLDGHWYATGSKFYKEFNEIDRALEQLQAPLNELTTSLTARIKAGEDRAKIAQEYQTKSEPIIATMRKGIVDLVKQHPDYEYSAMLVGEMETLKDMEDLVALLSPRVKEGRMKPLYSAIIDGVKKRQEADEAAKKVQAAGAEAQDFTLNDLDGKPLKLSSLRGKYVVLDFWGSWCVWCIKGFPEMKKYYDKYKDRMEILGVDCGDTVDKWKAAVKQHQLPWKHVYNAKGSNDVSVLYKIQGFPTKILIDPQGKIVKTIVGEDPEFYTMLDNLFAK